MLPSVPKHLSRQFLAVPREAGTQGFLSGKRQDNVPILLKVTHQSRGGSERTPRYPDLHLEHEPQSSTFHLSPQLHVRKSVGGGITVSLPSHKVPKGFCPLRVNVATNILTDFISPLKIIQKAVCEPGSKDEDLRVPAKPCTDS